ncbi:MAG: alanine--tRNA ligase [Desulfurococcaceae archaeon]
MDVNYKYLKEKYSYERYKCKVCGSYFWSRVPRDKCPDRPCSKYELLFKEYKNVTPLSIEEVRKRFIEFLRKRGHGVVHPYPVLAKWRNDLYLTIASIVVFQPEATDGITDPPHNPLVIIQPSIRLADIDNVGLTFGRHLSSFEMGGMHAFNKKEKSVYWSEGIIDNTMDFFVKEIGVDADDLVFKEGWWEGGGNAGPAPEVLVDGMELATLVHMAYKVVNGKYEPNPVLVVDCGYGIERIAWFTQRTPTGFHAVYGRLIEDYRNILGVEEPPHHVFKEIVYLLSDREIAGIDDLVKQVGQSRYAEYVRDVVNAVYLHSTLDHIRTASLMLSDGIVPSNAGEGYLARLIIRRLLRSLVKLGVEYHKLPEVLVELADRQIVFWNGDYIYGKFSKHRDYILEVLEVEANKFISTVLKGVEIVDKLIKRKKAITVGDLVELYDSHGIPPEFIAERASASGVLVEVPQDFYSKIAQRHATPSTLVKAKERELPVDVTEWASRFGETRKIFHEDPYITSLEATVIGVKGNYVVLDATIAYPWAGGQDHDEGVIRFGGDAFRLVYVGKVGDTIVHVLDRAPPFKPGDKVIVEIDWDRRYKLMKHHTATHIMLAAARRVLGEHVWQAGAEKTLEKARLDITHHKPVTPDEVRKIEDLANSVVNSRLDLKFHLIDRFKAEEKYGLGIHQGGAIYAPVLRIVEIPGWDAQACYGTHVYNTSEVGGIKVINFERIQDGVVRFEFIAGTRLVDYSRSLEEQRGAVLAAIGAKDQDVVVAVKKLYEEYQKQLQVTSKYRELVKSALLEKALKEVTTICNVPFTYIELPVTDEKLIRSLVEELAFKRKVLTAIAFENVVEISIDPLKAREQRIDLRKAVQYLSKQGFKGGGKEDHVVLRGQNVNINLILEALKSTMCVLQ